MTRVPNPVPKDSVKPEPPPAPPRSAGSERATVSMPFPMFEALCEQAAGKANEQIELLIAQSREQHASLLRFLGYLKDKLPQTTAWDLFAAVALPSALEAMKGTGGSHETKLSVAAELVGQIADALLAERTKREQAAVEARKKPESKE